MSFSALVPVRMPVTPLISFLLSNKRYFAFTSLGSPQRIYTVFELTILDVTAFKAVLLPEIAFGERYEVAPGGRTDKHSRNRTILNFSYRLYTRNTHVILDNLSRFSDVCLLVPPNTLYCL